MFELLLKDSFSRNTIATLIPRCLQLKSWVTAEHSLVWQRGELQGPETLSVFHDCTAQSYWMWAPTPLPGLTKNGTHVLQNPYFFRHILPSATPDPWWMQIAQEGRKASSVGQIWPSTRPPDIAAGKKYIICSGLKGWIKIWTNLYFIGLFYLFL